MSQEIHTFRHVYIVEGYASNILQRCLAMSDFVNVLDRRNTHDIDDERTIVDEGTEQYA